jgi:hypothetical protein
MPGPASLTAPTRGGWIPGTRPRMRVEGGGHRLRLHSCPHPPDTPSPSRAVSGRGMKGMKDEAPGVPHLLFGIMALPGASFGGLCPRIPLRHCLAAGPCVPLRHVIQGRAGGASSRPTGLPTRQHATACVLYGRRIAGTARAEGDRSRTPTDMSLRSPAPVSAGSARQVRSPGLSTRNGTSMA